MNRCIKSSIGQLRILCKQTVRAMCKSAKENNVRRSSIKFEYAIYSIIITSLVACKSMLRAMSSNTNQLLLSNVFALSGFSSTFLSDLAELDEDES